MKIPRPLLLLLFIATWLSCGKDDDSEIPETEATCRISHAENPYREIEISYNSEGRIRQIIDSQLGHYTYAYSGNTIVIDVEESTGPKKITLTLNDAGLVINRKTELGPGVFSSAVFEYNGSQLISSHNTYSDGFEVSFTYSWSQGNLQSIFTDGNLVKEFEYYTDRPVSVGDYSLFEEYFIHAEHPVYRNTNLLKSSITHFGQEIEISNYEYTFDADGKITSIVQTRGGAIITTQYNYECN